VSTKHIFRVEKTRNYSVMSNYHLDDKDLSWKAKGIHTYILRLPDNWVIRIEHLVTVGIDKEKSTRSGMKELYDKRYWQKYPVYLGGKVSHWETKISEIPFPEEEIIKSIVIKGGKEKINYVIDREEPVDNSTEKSSKTVHNAETIENTDTQLLSQNVHVGNVDVGNLLVEKEGLSSTYSLSNTIYNNNSVSQSDGQINSLFKQIVNDAQIDIYNERESKLFKDAVLQLLYLHELKVGNKVYSRDEIHSQLQNLTLSLCDIALHKFQIAIKKNNVTSRLRYFMVILFNVILEGSAEDYKE
jgi:hypothetical protein